MSAAACPKPHAMNTHLEQLHAVHPALACLPRCGATQAAAVRWHMGADACLSTARPPTLSSARRATEDQWLLYDGMRAQLLDPEFANDTVHFMELQVGGRLTVPCFVLLVLLLLLLPNALGKGCRATRST